MLSFRLAPRAFDDIFKIVDANQKKFTFTVTCYMIELYCDRLIDLFNRHNEADEGKLRIRKNAKGLVVIDGSVTKTAKSAEELYAIFEQGSANRCVVNYSDLYFINIIFYFSASYFQAHCCYEN